jgi:hypothetical protein
MVHDPGGAGRNEGEAWSDTDLLGLTEASARGDTIAEIALFLRRSEREVVAKMFELGLLAAARPSL